MKEKTTDKILDFIEFLSTATGKLLAIVVAIAIIPSSAIALAFFGVPVAGIHWFDKEEVAVAPPAPPQISNASLTETPAGRLFTNVFKEIDGVWEASPISVDSAGLPHPFDCVMPAPSVSISQGYDADGDSVQVTLAAYPAGVGAEAYKRLTGVASCKPAGTNVYLYGEENIGVEASSTQTSWAENNIRTTFFRRGDMIAFVASDRNANSSERARVVDNILKKLMTPQICVDQESGLLDQRRNALFSGKKFTGKLERENLTTEKLEVPELTPELEEAGVPATNLPAKLAKPQPVDLPSDDYDYILWPSLPTAVTVPAMPETPKEQKLESNPKIRVADLDGPGCGWAFLETAEAFFNEDAVEASNQLIIQTAQDLLDADGPRWQKDVLAYWQKVYDYRADMKKYEEYRAQVEEVRAAWEIIHADWRQYYTDYANWEIEEEARLQFIADKETARAQYKAQQDACRALPGRIKTWETEHEEWETVLVPAWEAEVAQYEEDLPELTEEYQEDLAEWRTAHAEWKIEHRQWKRNGEKGPEPVEPERPKAPAPPAKPAEPTKPTLDHPCPPVKPAILSQQAPKKTDPPAKPADPRP